MRRALIITVALGGITIGCEHEQAKPTPESATLERVAEQPNQYLGKRVTIMGEVDDVISTRAFQLEDDSGVIFEKELLVLTKSPVMLGGKPLAEDDELFVTGKVTNLVTTEIERELGWDLDPQLEVEWSQKPVLVAESISQMTPYAQWSEEESEPASRITMVSMWIAPDPKALVGKEVDLPPLRVRSVTPEGLWVGFSHFNQLFVVPPKAQLVGLEVGDWVSIEGTLRAMPTAPEAIAKWSMDEQLSAQVAEEPLYLDASKLTEVPQQQSASGDNEKARKTVEWASFKKQTPTEYENERIEGEAKIARVVSERAFWLDKGNGKQVLAVVQGTPSQQKLDIAQGQSVRFQAEVMTPKATSKLDTNLDQATKDALKTEPSFLVIRSEDLEQVSAKQ